MQVPKYQLHCLSKREGSVKIRRWTKIRVCQWILLRVYGNAEASYSLGPKFWHQSIV